MMFAVPAVYAADFVMDGNQLVSDCKNSETAFGFDEGKCIAFVIGVENGFEMAYVVQGIQKPICLPSGVTNGQAVKVVVKFMKNHPEDLHQPAVSLTLKALIEAFPCHVEPGKPKK
jgi:hypothetical protein